MFYLKMKFGTYSIDMEKIKKSIEKQRAKRVLLQFPDGLKPYATEIAKEIETETSVKTMIWLGSCFGACDIPPVSDKYADMIIQFGHSPWVYKDKNIKIIK